MPYPDTRHRLISLLKQLGVAALYALLAKIVLTFFSANGVVSIIWPSSGLALAVLLIGGKRYLWSVFFGAFLLSTMAGATLITSVSIATGNTLEALIGAWLFTRNSRFDTALQSLRSYLLLILAGSIGSIGSALNGATTLRLSGFLTSENYFASLTHWWMGDVLGIALITPLILVCWQSKNSWREAKRVAEAALLLGLTFLVGQIIFIGWFHASIDLVAKGYVMFLFITWVAVRLGTHGTVIALTIAATQALLGAYRGIGYFANDIGQTQLANCWLYLMILSGVGMALSTFISGQKLSEKELRRSETKFRTLYDSTSEAVTLMDAKGFFDCNSAALLLFGCATKEEFCKKQPSDISSPQQPDGTNSLLLANRYIAIAMEKGSHRFEWVCNRLDTGKTFVTDTLLSAVELDGRVVLQAVARDITKQKQAIEEFERFFNLIPDMACIASTDGYFKKINRAWQMTLGYTEQEILSTPFLDFIHPDDIDATMREVERQLLGGKPSRYCNRYRCKNGSYKLLEWDMIPPVDGSLLYGSARDVTEQKRAEEELNRFFDLVPDLVCIASTDGRFLRINRAWQTTLGYTEQEILATPFLDFIHPDDRDTTMKEVERQMVGAATTHFSNRYRCKDGGYKWLEWDATPAVDKTLLFASARDITARKKTEEALSESEKMLRQAQSIARIGHFKFNPASNIVEGSDELFNIFGLSREQFQFSDFANSVHPDDRDFDMATIKSAIERKTGYEIEHRLLLRDGTLKWVRVVGQFIAASPEERSLLVGTVQDITEYKRAEESLVKNKERLRAYLNNISDTVWVVRENLDITYVSSGVTRLMGILPEESIGCPSAMYIHPDDMGAIGNAMQYLMAHPGETRTVQYRVKHKDGRWIPVESTGVNLLDNPAINGILVTMRDITERKAIEQQLHDLSAHILDIREQEKSHIAREIHDELGGTLTALKIDTHWLLRKLPVNEETTVFIERAKSMSQRIDSAISTTRHIIDNMRPTILDDLGLLAAIEWQASEFQKNTGIECTVNCIEDEANLDNQRSIALFRILQETLTNVSRHSDASRVKIEFHHSENEAILIVADNGCGIPENHMAISKSYGSKSYGILGMTERVNQLGGKIIFCNPKDGGFTVEVVLPLPAGDRSAR